MARRKDHTREELTELAIACGREIVIREGPAALTARRVAKAMGYTPGTLYNIFENIDALVAAINIGSMHQFADTLRSIRQQQASTEGRVRGIAQAYLDFHQQAPQLWSLLFAVPVQHESESYHQAIHAIFAQVTEAITPLSSSPTEARRKAKILWSTLHGICLLQQSGKLNVGQEDSAEELVAQFLDQFLAR
ncbi:MAG: TetR/AcrR family transcriptional regulator [Puniceicoccaceae bacterium]|nr:MAG: TetR/AcrR family transcriptional regulator [Puniceicoccaceae bacterium]